MPIQGAPYVTAFGLILSDFQHLCGFVEPCDANLGTYSHRLYEILLRSCTECESLWKDALSAGGATKPRNRMNIDDYKGLEATLELEVVQVGWHVWNPGSVHVSPFAGWSSSKLPLGWYRDYNSVKHDRAAKFTLANLGNVQLALSGLFATLVQLDLFPTDYFASFKVSQAVKDMDDIHYVRYPQLSLRRPEKTLRPNRLLK